MTCIIYIYYYSASCVNFGFQFAQGLNYTRGWQGMEHEVLPTESETCMKLLITI